MYSYLLFFSSDRLCVSWILFSVVAWHTCLILKIWSPNCSCNELSICSFKKPAFSNFPNRCYFGGQSVHLLFVLLPLSSVWFVWVPAIHYYLVPTKIALLIATWRELDPVQLCWSLSVHLDCQSHVFSFLFTQPVGPKLSLSLKEIYFFLQLNQFAVLKTRLKYSFQTTHFLWLPEIN